MLLAVALFGLIVPNGIFLYWLVFEMGSFGEILNDHLGLAFVIDAALATGILAYLFAKRAPGPIRWPWFVVLALAGGLGFAIPFYLWWNFRRSVDSGATFTEWLGAGPSRGGTERG